MAGSSAGPHSKSSKRLDAKKVRGEKVEGINALPRELLGTYDIYLLPPHDESLNPRGNHSLSFAMLDNKKQTLWSLQSSLLG